MAARLVVTDAAETLKGRAQINTHLPREIVAAAKARMIAQRATQVQVLSRLLHLYATNPEVQSLVDDDAESKG